MTATPPKPPISVELPKASFDDKEFAIRSIVEARDNKRITLWIGTALRKYLERAGWRFRVLGAMPDPDADDGSRAYLLRVRHMPPGGVA